MKNVHMQIEQMKNELKKIEKKAALSYEKAVTVGAVADKRLQIMKKGLGYQYYVITGKGSHNGQYIRVQNLELAKVLAQRDYDLQVMKSVKKWLRTLEQAEKLLESIPDEMVSSLHQAENLHPGRRTLIQPYELSDTEFSTAWCRQPYQRKTMASDDICYITNRDERVRSKSEKIIADRLADAGIPYRYEAPLRLKRNLLIYPDFTILIPMTRRQVYFEHLGMIDRKEYADSAARKMNSFAEAGLVIGKDVFFTFETATYPISEAALNGVVQTIRKL